MKALLTAVNAKYIHSNLGIYSLKKYGERQLKDRGLDEVTISMAEYTINHRSEDVLGEIYRHQPDFVGFSCYIWNISYILELIQDLHQILPHTEIWLGGPEVSYHARELLETQDGIAGIMTGEGEAVFGKLICLLGETLEDPLRRSCGLEQIPGLVYKRQDGSIGENPNHPLIPMDQIPFSYDDLGDLEHRIVYYESSRGCPFSCSYCLSSIDKTVRFRSIEKVKAELDFFIQRKVPQVKFVDRTFNCKKDHALAIWHHILKEDNGITNFHFEISADLLDSEQLEVLKRMRPGLVQLEIGVQSTNEKTIEEIRRKMDLQKLSQAVACVNEYGNIHQHLDLIAGLPWEDYESFSRSFNQVYHMRPQQLQLGFLKVLKGSHMEEMVNQYGLSYSRKPPYEVLSTKWLSYEDVLKLKDVEEMVEVYYNSGQFTLTVRELEKDFSSPFAMFETLAAEYRGKGLFDMSHNRQARYQILFSFVQEHFPDKKEIYQDLLVTDLYLRENCKSRPSFARDLIPYKAEIRDFFIKEAQQPLYLKGYKDYDSRQIGKMAHVEILNNGSWKLFDYLNKDPLTGNASLLTVREEDGKRE